MPLSDPIDPVSLMVVGKIKTFHTVDLQSKVVA
jgi:hypothetical protein